MAKKTNLYRATVIENEETKEMWVDIFNLPYEIFNNENPLTIYGDVKLNPTKTQTIPNMKNVIFTDSLDLGTLKITEETVLPDELPLLICPHSINSLADLPSELPKGLKEIKIRSALMNNIKKDKDGALRAARRFSQKHLHIMVTDAKNNEIKLKKLLKDIDAKNINKNTEVPVPNDKETPTINNKTDEYYSTDELIHVCREASQALKDMDDAELARYIKKARSTKANLKIKTTNLRRTDGAIVVCVHKDYTDTIINFITTQINEDKERSNKTKTPKKKSVSKTKPEQKVTNTTPKYQLNDQTLEVIEIKKYISKRDWKAIQSACGNSKETLLNILQDIEAINIDPTTYKSENGKVCYIQNNEIKPSKTIVRKNSKYLSQGFETTQCRQRIVWGICGNKFITLKFFKEHDQDHERKRRAYKNIITDSDIDISAITLSEYYDVRDLIKNFFDGPDIPFTPDEPNIPDSPDTSDTTEMPDTQDIQTTEHPTNQTAVQIEQANDKQQSTEDNITDETTHKPDEAKTEEIPQTLVWKEIGSIQHYLTKQIYVINNNLTQTLQQMQSDKNTDSLLHLTQNMTKALQRKKVLEEASEKLEQIRNILINIQDGKKM